MHTFTKYHLAIQKDRLTKTKPDTARHKGLYTKEIKPDYEVFSRLIDRVGSTWGWTRRPRYALENRNNIEKLLKKPTTRLFLLMQDNKIVGYCMTTRPKVEKAVLEKLGYSSETRHLAPKLIEIENFGLFPQYTGKKYGQYFLPKILEKLFEKYETVYLSTRSTNHARVVPFYEGIGMKVIHQETLPDDLIPFPTEEEKITVYA